MEFALVGPPPTPTCARLASPAARAAFDAACGRVYLSMTTTPRRLRYVPRVLAALDLRAVAAVFLNLPDAVDGVPYPPLPPSLPPAVCVTRCRRDDGPATKLLPTLRLQKLARNDIVITLDDDTAYPSYVVEAHLDALAAAGVAAGGGLVAGVSALRGNNVDHWGLPHDPAPLPFTARVEWPHSLPPCLRAVDVVEGFGSVAYVAAAFLDDAGRGAAMTEALLARHDACRASDDYVISAALAAVDVPRWHRTDVPFQQFGYGFGADALHLRVDNAVKYRAAAAAVEHALTEWYGRHVVVL